MSGQIVTIPREISGTIEYLRSKGANNETMIRSFLGDLVDERYSLSVCEIMRIQAFPFDTLLSAVINGYEVELTEEERLEAARRNILAAYEAHRETRGQYETSESDQAYADGISDTLDWLGIEIKGVTDVD